MNERYSKISRKTKETDIEMELWIDGSGKTSIDTGIGFFDHMSKVTWKWIAIIPSKTLVSY